MNTHLESAEDMLKHLKQNFEEIRSVYFECEKNLIITTELRVKSYQYLLNCRSVFEYCAHEIASFTGKTRGKIYFPFARHPMTKVDFSDSMQKWYPNLEKNYNQLYLIIERFQYFNENSWIPAMLTITNNSKHTNLSLQTRMDCEALVIMAPGKGAIQLGDRGLKEITIEKGGAIKFEHTNGTFYSIRGPQTLSITTKKLNDADPQILLHKRKWQEIKFDDYPDQPALALLSKAAEQANYLYFEIAKIVSRKTPSDLPWPLILA